MARLRNDRIPEFLASETTWQQRLGDGWVGTTFLGSGCAGSVGLWEYKGNPTTLPSITKVVVKQSSADPDLMPNSDAFGSPTPFDEANILKKLSRVRTNHTIKQYGANLVGESFPGLGSVVRLFLEYCPGGDLGQFIERDERGTPKHVLDEADLWAIFHCLALGVIAMTGYRQRNVETGLDYDTDLCHYDIKPDNSKSLRALEY